jgi:competence protein ComEC
MHKSQVFLGMWVAFLAGVGVGSFWIISSSTLLALVVVAAVVLGASAYRRTFGDSSSGIWRRKIGFLAGCLLLVFSLGVWRFNAYDAGHSFVAQFADRTVKGNPQSVTLCGYVDGDFETHGTKARFTFRVKEIVVPRRIILADERVLVQTNPLPTFRYGDVLQIDGPINIPENFSDEFDYVAYLEKSGIRAIVSYPDIVSGTLAVKPKVYERWTLTFFSSLFSVRDWFSRSVAQILPEPHAGYMNGILLGTRQQISDSLMEAFKRTGTSHVIALSGYNITIVAEVCMAVLLVWLRRRKAFWLTIVGIVLFVIMTGASASVVRAAIMGALMLFALGYGRLSDIQNAVVFAAGVMVLINPFILRFDAGFQLSFIAVLGLIYISPLIAYALRRMPALSGVREIIVATISAQIAVLPLILYSFKLFSIVALVANIIILPLMPAAMLFGFAAGVAGLVSVWLGRVVGIAAWAITQIQLSGITALSSLPMAAVSVSLPYLGMFAMYGAMIVLVVFARWKLKDKLA